MRTLIFLGVSLAAASTAAQIASQQELEACAAIERAIERLDCFETLTARGAAPAPGAAESATRASGQPPEPESAPAQEAGAAPVAGPTPESGPESGAAADLEQSVPAPPAPAPEAGRDRLENVGVEQLPDNRREERTRERDDIGATVTEVSEGPRGNLLFHLENGQIWRQIEARYVPLPADAPFSVRISQGLFGEYRLRVGGEGRLVRIRRVQ